MNKKRWWAGFGIGLIAALSLLALTFALWPGDDAIKPLLAYLVCALISGAVTYYTNFGHGRQEYVRTWSDCSRAYTNSYLAVDVPPYPFVGGAATGYWALFTVTFAGAILYGFFIK